MCDEYSTTYFFSFVLVVRDAKGETTKLCSMSQIFKNMFPVGYLNLRKQNPPLLNSAKLECV